MRGIWGISPVYPRWRGEHHISFRLIYLDVGLSPLARGTRCEALEAAQFHRFIPAGAGNTFHDSAPLCGLAVYPRWRGEHLRLFQPLASLRGLSPLARGTPISRAH